MSSGSLFAQAAWLGLVAGIYPPAILLAGLYLRSERPGKVTPFFVAGGLFVVTVVGVVVLVVMRAGGLSHFGHHQTRYGVRLGLGVIALIAAVVLYLRKPKPPDPSKPKKPNRIQRLSARPTPVTAFAVGVFMFGPSVAFISAVQVVATAKTSIGDTIGAMAMIIVLAVAFAWLPFLAYLIAPERTVRLLHSLEGRLARHGRTILVAVVGVIGVFLVIQGITGLVLGIGIGVTAARDVASRAPAQERGQRENHHRDAETKEKDALLVVGLDRDVHEGDRRDQDQHGDHPGFEVFQVTHPQPFRQPARVLVPFLPQHEQLVEAERGDHQRGTDQEGVHHDQEDAEPAADPGRLAYIVRHRPQQDVGAVDERTDRIDQQEDDRDEDQQPGAGQYPLEPLLQSAGDFGGSGGLAIKPVVGG
ncbi:MAG TPA: GAP family protein [Streptosporangiaceae bacterium]|nr:GAP family protein [Streptosporangiaceae bacterium]